MPAHESVPSAFQDGGEGQPGYSASAPSEQGADSEVAQADYLVAAPDGDTELQSRPTQPWQPGTTWVDAWRGR